MRNKLYLLLVLLVGIVQVGMAQEKTITGVVTDADDGSPLPGVSVVIKGTHWERLRMRWENIPFG